MAKFLLDTDICIEFLKGRQSVKEKILEVGIDNCFVSEITIVELIYGAYHSNNYQKHIQDVREIKKLFQILPIYDSFDLFGKEKSRLRTKGELIPDFDLLIGVTAIHHQMKIVTNNHKHLSRIKGIQLENWMSK